MKYLPEKFKLNPDGNEELSKAIQERLLELGMCWCISGAEITNTGDKWIFFNCGRKGYLTHDDYDSTPDAVLLTLQDLYTLKPRPKNPTIEIAGRTLELIEDRLVGPEFDESAAIVNAEIKDLLKAFIWSGHIVQVAQVRIRCQTLCRSDLMRLRDFLKENL